MDTLALHSYKRKLYTALVLVLTVSALLLFHMYKEQKTYTVYLSEGKTVLTGSSSQLYTQVEQYYAPCEQIYDEEMYVDEICVTQEGSPGMKEVTMLTSYYNGNAVESKILEENILEEATPRVVHIGVKERPEYMIPVANYVISSNFGARWGRSHEGVDLAVATGTEVIAADAGTVTKAGYFGGYGLCIDIDHGNGVATRYGHMSQADVTVGDYVEQGEHIGLSGNTGYSTGPHLHFEIRIDGEAVNPLEYVDGI